MAFIVLARILSSNNSTGDGRVIFQRRICVHIEKGIKIWGERIFRLRYNICLIVFSYFSSVVVFQRYMR